MRKTIKQRGRIAKVKLRVSFSRLAREGLSGKVTVTVLITGNIHSSTPWVAYTAQTHFLSQMDVYRCYTHKSLKYDCVGTIAFLCFFHSLGIDAVPPTSTPAKMPRSRCTGGTRTY